MSRSDAQLTMDALADGVVIADESGLIRVINQVGCTMLGTSAADAVGRKLGDVLLLQDQDGATWIDTNQPYAHLAIRTGVPEQAWHLPSGLEVLVTARILRADRSGRSPVSR